MDKLLTYFIIVLALCCDLSNAGGIEQEDFLIFDNLRLVYNGIDFPPDLERLNYCKKTGNKACIETFNLAQKAKDILLSMPHNQALDLVLNTIKKRCSQDFWDADPIGGCDGANAALYFFKSGEDDEKIRMFFVDQTPEVKRRIIDYFVIHEWQYNRPDKSKWKKLIDQMDNITEEKKSFYKSLLNTERKITIEILK